MYELLTSALPSITARQRQVVELIAAGCSNEEVGERLGISPRTAKAHAGYGKTTLAREWLAEREFAWYRGSPASAGVAALAVGLAEAAATIVPGAGERMQDRLRATGTPEQDVQPLAELLAEDLQDWPQDTWLAFDDYQFACESEFSERFVDLLCSLTELRLLLASRVRPN